MEIQPQTTIHPIVARSGDLVDRRPEERSPRLIRVRDLFSELPAARAPIEPAGRESEDHLGW